MTVSDDLVTRSACACGSSDFEAVLSLPPSPAPDAYQKSREAALALPRYPLDLWRCLGCGLIQLRPVVRPDLFYANYLYATAHSPGLPEHFDAYAEDVVRRYDLRPGDLAIDIGCNDGTLLYALERRSLRVVGVEPSAVSRRATGLHVVNDYFSGPLARDLRAAHGAARLVAANNVLPNVLDLGDFFRGVADLLADDGVFVFEACYLPRILANAVVEMINHEHYYYFEVEVLRRLLPKFGLRMAAASVVATKGGSLRCVAVRLDSRIAGEPAPESLVAEERAKDVVLFEARWRRAMAAAGEAMEPRRAGGGPIAAFGAGAPTTILVACSPFASRIELLADDNAERHGLFAPGSGIPVVSPDDWYARKPAATIVYAWRYAEAIIARHKKFLPRGHRFVIPLPEARIVET